MSLVNKMRKDRIYNAAARTIGEDDDSGDSYSEVSGIAEHDKRSSR